MGFALHNIGVVYFWKENYSLALQYANESLACRTKILTSLEVNDEKQYKHKDEIMDVAVSGHFFSLLNDLSCYELFTSKMNLLYIFA